MSEYFVGTIGANNQTTFESFTSSEVLDDLQLNTTHSPTFAGLNIGEYIRHDQDSNTYLRFTADTLRLAAGGVEMIKLSEGTDDAIIFNEAGGDVDFRVESSGEADALFVRGSDGNVGIGTTSPLEELHVAGNALITDGVMPTLGNYAFGFGRHSGGPSVYGGMYGNGLNRYLTLRGANGIKFFVNNHAGDSVFTIDGDPGNVGIGTTNPNHKLDIESASSASSIRLKRADTNDSLILLEGTNYGYLQNTTGPLGLGGSNNDRDILIDTSGNVGIGTINPSHRLDVESTDDVVASFNSLDNKCAIALNDDDTTVYLSAENGRGAFGFQAGTHANNLNIDVSGNVGIGTTSPDSLLELSSGSVTDFLKLTSTGGGATPIKLIFEKGSSEQGIIEFNRNGDLELYNTDADGGVMIDGSASAGGDFYVANSGNVGIGTTSPTRQLEVSNTGDAIIRIAGDSDDDVAEAGGAVLEMTTDNGGHGWTLRSANIGGGAGDFSLNHFVGGTESTKFLIERGGNVGIGTTSPAIPLHVKGNIRAEDGGSSAFVDLKASQIYATNAYDVIVGTNNPLHFRTSDTRRMTILGDGKVGIGTTTPATPLHVTGEVRVDATEGVAARKIRSNYFSSGQNLDLVCGASASLILGDGTARLTLASDDSATFAGSVTATSLIKSGGTSSQFLKADGSVDSTTYVSSETYSTPSALLTAIKTVDGSGTGLDADKLDGQEGSYYLNYNNFSNTPTVNDVSETNLLNRLAALDSSDTIYIGDAGDDTTVVVRGTLQVDGSTTTINSNTLSIGDNQIVLNNDVTGTPTQDAGIIVERGTSTNASLIWDEANDYWKAGLAGSEVQLALTNGTYSGLRAQSTTKGDVGLGNVTNESKATMFTSPTFTGAVTLSGSIQNNDSNTSIDLNDHGNYTWFRNSANRWIFQGGTAGDDWTQHFALNLEATGSGFNDKYAILGQQQNNGAAGGKYKGVRIVKSTGSSTVVDGELKAGDGVFSGNVTGSNLNISNWNTAYTDRNKWDGGSTGLTASTGRTSLGLGSAATQDTSAFAAASHTHTFASLTSKPTSLSGYGITDAYTSSETDTLLAAKAPLASPSFTGDVVITDDTFPFIQSSTNAAGVGIKFSDQTGGGQYGTLTFRHSDSQSYGSGASFILGTSETSTTILADGKLMYHEGIYSKPSTGTGAGTRKDSNWDTAYTHTSATNNPHSVTATQVGLGNVTNESKATMFTNPTFTGTTTVSGILKDGEYHNAGSDNWKTKKYIRSVGVTGADIQGVWVHLARVVIDVAYEKARIKFNINSYDDVASGVEAIDVSYENGASSQEHHILSWYSTDNNATTFSEVRSIRSSSSGLSNTYDLYVQMSGDWRDTFTVVAESWVTHGSSGTPITFPTSAGSSTAPTAGSDDKAATSRQWYTNNSQMYAGTNKFWHAGNDGTGSGLDADLLDGSHASAFATAAQGSSAETAFGWGNHASAGYAASSHTHAASDITSGTLNASRLPRPINGDWWNGGAVIVGTDGVMEVGKYLDFHTADSGGGTDYDVRVTASSSAISVGGSVTATSLIKSGGSSSEFLKADGSVDSSTYAASSHTHTFASLTSKPTTLSGYGITDAATSAQGTKADNALPKAGGTMTGQLICPSASTTRPVLTGGFISRNDNGDGDHDVHGLSERYYPSNSTTADAWGLQWHGTTNQYRFIGAGNVRLSIDLDGGNTDLRWNNNVIFHEGYHPNADTLTTARTIAGTSFNGSANIDISYSNLTNKPTIPTNNNQLTNGASYITASSTDTLTNKTWNGNVIDSDYIGGKITKKISGDGTSTTFTVTHNFGTPLVMTQLLHYGNDGTGATYEVVQACVQRNSDNAIDVIFGVAPTSSEDYLVLATKMPAIS